MPRPVRLETIVERHHPGMPRYVVIPASKVARWNLEGTTIVEGTLNGMPLGRRSLKPWDEERWFVELRKDWCSKAGISTGDQVVLALEVASPELPDDLAAKRPETRERRARNALGLEQDTAGEVPCRESMTLEDRE